MVEPPGAPLRSTWEPALLSRISLVGGSTLSRTYYTHNPWTESGSFLLLAHAQMFVGGVDVDYFVRDGPPKFPQYFGNSSLGKPSHRPQSESRMDGNHPAGLPQRVRHVREAPAPDEPAGGSGLAAIFVAHWIPQRDAHGYERNTGELFHDCRTIGDVVVLVADGPLFGVDTLVHGLWSRLLFCPH